MRYNWQLEDWPHFRFDLAGVEADLLAFVDVAGQVHGLLQALPEGLQGEAIVDLMISEAIKTSEIEGAFLSRQDVMSSIRNQLGLNAVFEPTQDQASAGVGELLVEVRQSWEVPLTANALFAWHRMLLAGTPRLTLGAWRTDDSPMQVVSGQIGRPTVHFEAPPSVQGFDEMEAFLIWFNGSAQNIRHAPVRAAIAHLYFESIHPFEDGNGRIGRAIAEKALSQGLGRPVLLSLSRSIEANKKDYYGALEQAQRSNDVTAWVQYFGALVLQAQRESAEQIDFVLRKTQFFDCYQGKLDERQLRVVRRMLDAGPSGFEGGMNARKYCALTKVSKATATRDLRALVELGVCVAIGGGRSARYELNLPTKG